MGKRTFEDVKNYVEWQSQGKCAVLSAKTEQHFDDLGVDVYVWNVKTDTDGDWWVVEGDNVPMNLYPQSAYYRNIIKKLTEATWDYANKITHSRSATYYEVSTCVTLCISLVGVYENILQKVFDPRSQYHCSICQSKKLSIAGDDSDENGIVQKLYLHCEECGGTTEVVFEKNDENDPSYITGKVIE